MAKVQREKSFLLQAKTWASSRSLFGPQAFLRYVILTYLEAINQVSRDFIFKGGNLLWVYIGTPRSTTDLDLATLSMHQHEEVKGVLSEACSIVSVIKFSIQEFKEITQNDKKGASVKIFYETSENAKNSFEIDIVYALHTDVAVIQSPIQNDLQIYAATVENIIVDKLGALQRFGAGNTRIKDLDDLWRMAEYKIYIRSKKLEELLKSRKTLPVLDRKWINVNMEKAWSNHIKRYPDLPKTLNTVFSKINSWLRTL